MKKITYLLSTLLIVSCTDNGLIDTEQLETFNQAPEPLEMVNTMHYVMHITVFMQILEKLYKCKVKK